jgi:exopolyphosphatase/guanosine-5'-triphosphate,3'-diphosphate pyrophosphatase
LIRGIISIGTNSTRALAAEFDPRPNILLARSIGTRIGEGLRENGRLQDEAMRRTLEAIQKHTDAVRELTPHLTAIATSALRRATNAEEFAEKARDIMGVSLETISGDEEARCSYAGAVSGLPADKTYGVLDVGGGSTEYAIRTAYVSCEIGAVRLTERFPTLGGVAAAADLAQARQAAREALAPIRSFESADRLIAVGGSATTSAAVIAGRRGDAVYSPLTRASLATLIEKLASLPLQERKRLPGMVEQRADILLAGALILDEAAELTGHSGLLVSTNDLLLGYLLRH